MKSLGYYYGKLFQKVIQGKRITGSEIDPTAKVNAGCDIVGCSVGRYSYLGYNCEVIGTGIGAFTSIAADVFIGGAEHPMDWVSMSPVFQRVKNSGPSKRFAEHNIELAPRTVIGNDVWIGHGAIVKAGVRIGDGAVIGAGSVVTKDVPPYAVVGGVPAKVLKYRFDEETIAALIQTQWWNADDDTIQKYAMYMNDIQAFLSRWGGVNT